MSLAPTEELRLYQWAAKGNEAAASLLLMLTDVAHVWDDVVDGDKPLKHAAIDASFHALVLGIPANPFYRQHRASLDPLVQQAAINWMVATAIERDPCAPKHVAYILRSSYVDLIGHVALIVGGPDWSMEVTRRVREINQDETMMDYLTNLNTEARTRLEV